MIGRNQRSRAVQLRHRVTNQHRQTIPTPGTYQPQGRSLPAAVASPAEQLGSAPDVDTLELVTVRKYGVDADSPWWRRLYFRAVHLPLQRFAFVMKIPPMGELDKDGRFSWLEYIGIATDAETAKKMCEGEFYEHHPLPVNSSLPRESIQYSEQVYEKAERPHRFDRQVFPRVQSLKDIAAERTMLAQLDALSRRILHKSQHRTSI